MKFTDQEIARFNSRFTVGETDKCWEWNSSRTRAGYGVIKIGKKDFYAHRFYYFLAHPEWDWSLMICHRCDNPPCVNPDHLFLGTAKDNCDDMTLKGRQKGRFGQRKQDNSGSKHGMAKFSEDHIRSIRRMAEGGKSTYHISTQFGIPFITAWSIIKRKRWAHIP